MPIWVVAVEYAGVDIEPHAGGSRRPVMEHAYDIETGLLAHGDDHLRVGFPQPTRGWPATPQLTRCVACTIAVTTLLTGMVADVVGRTVADLARWALRFGDLLEAEVFLRPRP